MAAIDLYSEKKNKAKPYPGAIGGAAPRTQRAPRLQGEAPQKGKREKSPSELGEEVLALVLQEDAPKLRQPAAAAQPASTKAAVGSQKAAQYGGFAEKTAAGNAKTAPYSGGAGRAAAQYEPPLYPPPAAGESAAPQALAAAGLDENAIRGARWRDDFSNAMQTIDEMTAPIRAMPEWQAQEAAQDLSYAGLDANAQLGLGYGDGLFRLDQKLDEMTAPIRATPEWQAVAESQQLSGLGLDTAAQMGYDMGQPIGAWASQLVEDTHLAPGTSVWDYFGDKLKSGAAGNLEGAWNGVIDFGEALTRADLAQQAWQAQQYAWIGAPYRQYADAIAESTQIIDESLPQAAENLRSHRAAEYAQYIDELYDADGLLKLGGDVASAMGQYIPTIAVSLLTGGMGGMPYLFTSAEGNASAEARANGADENMAFLYGLASGGKEFWTEKLFGGIPGLGKGKLDDLVMGLAQTERGRDVLKLAWDFLGEGAEEFLGEMADAYLAKMWNGDERGVWQTFQETLPDALYSGLVGALSSAGLNAPGNLSNVQYARALDVIRDGGTLSDAQMAAADTALQSLTNNMGKDSTWSRDIEREWMDARNWNPNYFFPLLPDSALDAVDMQKYEIEVQDAERDKRNDLIVPESDETAPESETLPNDGKNDMLSKEEREALGKAWALVPRIPSSLLNPEQQTRLRVACRQVLRAAAGIPRNTEVTMLFHMDATPIEKNGIFVGEPGAGSVEYTAPNEDFISVHNHSDGRTFSESDIEAFLSNDKYRMMVAVGHNGKVYVLEKYEGFNYVDALEFYENAKAQYPNRTENAETYIAWMEEVMIKGVEQYGASYYSR